MTLDMGNTDKLAEFRSEAQRLGIKVQPPSVNRSGVDFDVAGHAIHYALAALKGVGRTAVEAIVAARGGRTFTDFSDFARRINPRLVNKRVLESLAAAGAFDDLERDRACAVAAMDAVLATAQRTFEAETLGQSELFGGPAAPEKLVLPDVATWLPAERLQREYDSVGFFLSRQVKSGVTAGKVAATVVTRAERRTKTGNKMGIIGLSDPSGHYEAVIFAEGLQQFRDLLEPGRPVLLVVTAEAQGDEVRARIQSVEALDAAAAKVQKGLRIFLRDGLPLDAVAKRLDGKGDGEVNVVLLLDAGAEVEVRLPGRYKVSPQIAGAIKAVPGVVEVQAM
jgi:DNA polymerase-3 subunit alpha